VVGGYVVAQKISHMKHGHKQDTPTFVFSLTTDGYQPGITEKQGVCHIVALPFTLKKYLKAIEEELWKLKYFTMQKYNLQKNPLKETKILQDITTL
jgi:hypothetical protein